MKKRSFLLVLLLLVLGTKGIAQNARKVSEKEASQVAQSFVKSNFAQKAQNLSLVSASNIFIYNIDNHGFIIISGNTVLPPVLGYSNQGTFPSLEEAPDHFSSWIQHYSDMIDFAVSEGVQPEPSIQRQWDDALEGRFPAKNASSVEPLIATRWNQDCFYNEYCPETPGGGWWGGGPCGHVYAGCVACAMAQVMKYWNWPEQGFGSHGYMHPDYGQQFADFGATTYHWDQMPIEVYGHNDAVATLMYHCGVSVDMNYGAGGSGAQSSDVETACRSYFGYCGAKYKTKSQYNEEAWLALIKADLDRSYPIYYSGASSTVGHAFVCDGYDQNDLIHFNFGWSGSGDSYYSLYDVNGYSGSQAAVFNMIPMDIRPSAEGIIYVSADGEGNGSSWDNATSHLEFASFLSSGSNTRVWVKQGVYYGDTTDMENAFHISPSNRVYGSFNGDESPDYDLSQRDFINHASILDGQGVRRVLMQDKAGASSTMAQWDGFILQHGSSGSGSGAYINGFATLSHCIIRNNHTNTYGGGVYVNNNGSNNQVNLNNCTITGNTASLGGGLCDRSNASLINCIISNNQATTKGGGAYLYNSASTTFKGCLISNNTALEGGGIYSKGKSQLQNCTVVKNEGTDNAGGAYNEDPVSTFTSCIFWGNKANGNPNQHVGKGSFSYCAIQGGQEGTDNIDLPAENTGEEPGFYVRFLLPSDEAGASSTETNWRTESRSICVNRGKPGSATFSSDLDGQPRLLHDRIDIGAYESNASLTLIEQNIIMGDTYWFNGRPLQEPGYYTTVYPTPACDSVVGLSLHVTTGVDDLPATEGQVLSVEVFSLHGQYLTTVQRPDDLKAMLKPGCYLLRIHSTEGILVKKMLVTH